MEFFAEKLSKSITQKNHEASCATAKKPLAKEVMPTS